MRVGDEKLWWNVNSIYIKKPRQVQKNQLGLYSRPDRNEESSSDHLLLLSIPSQPSVSRLVPREFRSSVARSWYWSTQGPKEMANVIEISQHLLPLPINAPHLRKLMFVGLFQQDFTQAHRGCETVKFLTRNTPDFIGPRYDHLIHPI